MSAHPRAALAALAGATAVAFVDQTAVSVALPSIQHHLGASSAALHWVMTAYLLATGVTVAMCGRISDLVGARSVFLLGLVGFGVASAGAGFAPSIGWLIVFRIVQGLAAALVLPSSQALAVQTFGDAGLGRALGAILAIGSFALTMGPLIGGALVDWLGWRAVFFVNLPLIAVIVVAVRVAFGGESPRDPGTRLDLPGCLLLTGAATALTGAASAAGVDASWLGVLALVLIGGLMWRERRAEDPILRGRALRSRVFAAGLVAVFLLQFGPIALVVYGSIYLQDALGFQALGAGAAVLPATLSFLGASFYAGRLSDRIGARLPTAVGGGVMAVGLAGMAMLVPQRSYGVLIPGLLLFGIGLGLSAAPINATLLAVFPAEEAGSNAGLIATTRSLGSAFAVALLGTAAVVGERASARSPGVRDALVHHAVGSAGPAAPAVRDAIATGTAAAIWVAAAVSLAAAVVAVRYVPSHRDTRARAAA